MKKFLALTLLASAGIAQASPVHQTQIEDEAQELNVPLSPNKLEAQIAAEQLQRDRAEQPTGALEFGVSSWRPENLQPPSQIDNFGSFGWASVPTMNLNSIQPVGRELSLIFGISFASLQRTGALDIGGSSMEEKQTAYVPSVRAGVEYAPIRYSSRIFRPYGSASLMPTAVITSRSAFDNGQADLGLAGELGFGTLVHVSNSFDLNLGASEILGRVSSSSLNGFGIDAGIRVPL